jgi:hypothetical protein
MLFIVQEPDKLMRYRNIRVKFKIETEGLTVGVENPYWSAPFSITPYYAPSPNQILEKVSDISKPLDWNRIYASPPNFPSSWNVVKPLGEF